MLVAAALTLYEWLGLVQKAPHKILNALVGVIYISFAFGCYIFLRFGFEQGAWLAIAAMVCVWASDTGAFLVGKKVGGPKMAPVISPNKTWSGFAGALVFCGLALTALHFIGLELNGASWNGSGMICQGKGPCWVDPETFLYTNMGLTSGQAGAIFLIGCVLGAVGQAGDLFKSFYKRRAKVKDSGTLIPGHGGILDRIDSLMLVTPVFLGLVSWWLD
jgi:phosphatidate cytidylyltransferase